MSEGRHMVPVWFFVGVILLIYGVIILGRGSMSSLTPLQPCWQDCTPQSGGGGLLTLVGGFYVWVYLPRKY